MTARPQSRIPPRALGVVVALCLSHALASGAQDWHASVTPHTPGAFPPPAPLIARYRFGWSGIAAATARIGLAKEGDRFELTGTGGTTGLARTLWPYDVRHRALVEAGSLRPLHVEETEELRRKSVTTALKFRPAGVTSDRAERRAEGVKEKTRHFEFPNVQSVGSALLFLRSQALNDGAIYRVVVYPATSAYLVTVVVMGREPITVRAGAFNAIRLKVVMSKVGKDGQLEPHKKFREATVWLSNDNNRLVLRIEAQVFIGKVFAELDEVQPPDPAS